MTIQPESAGAESVLILFADLKVVQQVDHDSVLGWRAPLVLCLACELRRHVSEHV